MIVRLDTKSNFCKLTVVKKIYKAYMSTGQNLSYNSVGNSTPTPDQGSYDAGSYLSKAVGKKGFHKMPIYDQRASGEGLRSNLPSRTDLSHYNENFNGKQNLH